MISIEKIKNLVQYALLTAAQNDDPYDRQLGMIHLIKYLYLADMEYARWNDGATYTGIDWTFHNFGPWSLEALRQTETSLNLVHAKKRVIPNTRFGKDDTVRWSIGFDRKLYRAISEDIPLDIRGSVADYVRTYRDDTTALLHFVYATPPMLKAAPGEHLDFLGISKTISHKSDFTPYLERISTKKRKVLKTGMSELKKQFQMRVAEKQTRYRTVPRENQDEIYEAGLDWLNTLAGPDLPEKVSEAHFSDDIWKSKARSGEYE